MPDENLVSEFDSVWEKYCRTATECCPRFPESLRSGASDDQLDVLEEFLGFEIHPEHRLLLSKTNGTIAGTNGVRVNAFYLLSCEEIIRVHQFWLETLEDSTFDGPIEVAPRVKLDRCWQRKWVFCYGSNGIDGIVVDLDPPESGVLGQMFEVDHEFCHSEVFVDSPMKLIELLTEELPKQSSSREDKSSLPSINI
jgi:cell wall assembly regulator SMI1